MVTSVSTSGSGRRDASARLQERRETRSSAGQADADAEDQVIDESNDPIDGDARA